MRPLHLMLPSVVVIISSFRELKTTTTRFRKQDNLRSLNEMVTSSSKGAQEDGWHGEILVCSASSTCPSLERSFCCLWPLRNSISGQGIQCNSGSRRTNLIMATQHGRVDRSPRRHRDTRPSVYGIFSTSNKRGGEGARQWPMTIKELFSWWLIDGVSISPSGLAHSCT